MSNKAAANVTIKNRLGLHARPAMMFVEAVSKFTRFDSNGDGWILEAEYNAAIDAWRTGPAHRVQDVNSDTDGNTN